MVKFTGYLALVLCMVLGSESQAQLFPRLRANATTSCGGAKASGLLARLRPQVTASCSGQALAANCSTEVASCSAVSGGCPTGTCSLQESVVSLPQTAYVAGVTESIQAKKMTFRQALMKAAGNAHRNGDLTILQYFAVARSSLNPTKLAEMQQSVHEAAVQEGLATVTAIDWDGLISFIERLLPIILKLIELFGYNMNDVDQFYVSNGEATLIMTDGFVFTIAA